jgi:hypothetical protein
LIFLLIGTCAAIALQKVLQLKSGAELAGLLSTASPSSVTLQNSWVGESKVVFRTDKWPIPIGPGRREGESLVFDKFCFWDNAAPSYSGQKTVGESIGTLGVVHQHVYRTSLPLDTAILQAKTEGDLIAILGQPHHPSDFWSVGETMHTSAGWRFFSLSERTFLQTLSVYCLLKQSKGESDWQVEGIELRRGTATPTR